MAQNDKPGVFCLEGPWSGKLDDASSVRPLLELLARRGVAPFIHRDVATRQELEYYLKKWTQKQYSRYSFGYLGFHGEAGKIKLAQEVVSLEELGDVLEGRCQGRILYLGSCETLAVKLGDLRAFQKKTKARAVCGYVREVDWIEAAAFDLNLIDCVAGPKRTDAGFKRLRRDHEGECRRLGFRAVWNGGQMTSYRR